VPLLGPAALAMWWDMAPALRAEFEDWHSHEHFPERLAIPGFLRASRWASVENEEGFFVLYELASYETLTSPAYRARLNDPTPWSRKLMPEHRNMVRSQSRVLESAGSLLGGFLATWRFSPPPGEAERLRSRLGAALARLAVEPGLVGAHLLATDTPAAAETAEQRLRGGRDGAADWILLVAGFDPAILGARLADVPIPVDARRSLFRLSHGALAAER
jgi:hypothetical protein